ncbi:TraM recognition domain-containing protein [Embleya sp. NPDC005971]|uniref:type IV secretory system conjugative DNA transfer family protein n=1 Tax=Embleya sp. NPDC005971 TaxID=3156724 RepID=UPI0033C5F033
MPAAAWTASPADGGDPFGSIGYGSVTGALAIGAGLGLAAIYTHGRIRRAGGDTGDGFASRRSMERALSAGALIGRRHDLRPSLAGVRPRRVDPLDLGSWLGTPMGQKWQAYLACEDSLLMVAPPGGGKTAYLGHVIIDAPGPAVVTSTKVDVLQHTEALRAERGPVWLFNPDGLAGRESTIDWDPVPGCADPEVAIRRAGHLLAGSDGTAGTENRQFWEGNSFKVLKAFLWAADVDGRTLHDVAKWSKNQADLTAIEIMREHEDRLPQGGWLDDLVQAQIVKGKPTTWENVFSTLSMTFMCLGRPRVAEMIDRAHAPGARPFDVDAFLSGPSTLYMLGKTTKHGGIGPLFSCLVGEIHDRASELASYAPTGRLDPPLRMVLDEAALICPVPLETWSSDSRGKNIGMIVAMQSMSQLYNRWGNLAGQTIWGNLAKYILGGLSVGEHLKEISNLCGEREDVVETRATGPSGVTVTRSTRMVPVMSQADIREQRPGEALYLAVRGLRPVLMRYTPVWDRPDVRGKKALPGPVPVPEPAPGDYTWDEWPEDDVPTDATASPASPVAPPAAAPSAPAVPPMPTVAPRAAGTGWEVPTAPAGVGSTPPAPVPPVPLFPPAGPVEAAEGWPPRLYVVPAADDTEDAS